MTNFKFQKSCALGKINQRHTVSERVVNPANLGGIRRHGETGIKQALVEAVPGPEQHLMPTRRDQIVVPIGGRVMNAQDDIMPRPVSLKSTLPSWNTSCALLIAAGDKFRPLQGHLLCPCLVFQQVGRRAKGTREESFGLYFHIEKRR